MSENVNRKACDRCHSQKLSCKRVGDGVCDRCLRLNAECKSSPSLRYKRQLQQQDQMQEQKPQQQSQQPEQSQLSYHCHQDQQQQRQPRPNYQQGQIATCQRALNFETQPHTEAQDSAEGRSPKRRRTGSEVHPVQRDAGMCSLTKAAAVP
ncbi:Fungal transcriptional regulatory protein [Cordyceps fumosorosea ARSEF 2679]|uniref:Fungal transcriptional regulatory protein n=1 Tax=Cordyceps fumosorosea (strain ARSEF 2679) TaxID=1081104 RepID=A0A167W027_CORFA|nr:Fungal transcriptional regulatory protein [Cordyceps fumosorosea ARSEF 2679]OAA63165.1 Fungal transcriptional regulatory protein [Cordyceps fumosorosea ARSEF 2679]